MKDELFHIASVKDEYIAKILSRKIYKKFGWKVRWTDSSSSQFYSIDMVDGGDLSTNIKSLISGYAQGILEMLLSVTGD